MSGKKGKAVRKNLELAYDVYCAQGGNKSATLKVLKKDHGLKLSRPTFDAWIKDYRFEARLLKAEAERQRMADTQLSFEEQMLKALVERKAEYDTYFQSSKAVVPETQMMYAYTNLVKTIIDIQTKLNAYKADTFTGFMRDLIDWLGRNDPKALLAIEKNFDPFIKFAREKYAS